MGFVKKLWNGITGKTQANAAVSAANTQADASRYAADISHKQYEQTRQDQMPWMQAGQKALGGLSEMLYGNGSQFVNDPGYQWRKQQGMDNIQASAAAGGGLLSGATLKALNQYNSDLASQEYMNAYNRLAGVANTGQVTASNIGQMGANNAAQVGSAMTNAANAQANGIIGATNARTAGLGNLLGIGAKILGAF